MRTHTPITGKKKKLVQTHMGAICSQDLLKKMPRPSHESWNINQIMHLSSVGFNAPGKRWKPLRRKRPHAPDNCSFCWVRGTGSKFQVSNSFQSLVIVLELTQASRQVPFPQGLLCHGIRTCEARQGRSRVQDASFGFSKPKSGF